MRGGGGREGGGGLVPSRGVAHIAGTGRGPATPVSTCGQRPSQRPRLLVGKPPWHPSTGLLQHHGAPREDDLSRHCGGERARCPPRVVGGGGGGGKKRNSPSGE